MKIDDLVRQARETRTRLSVPRFFFEEVGGLEAMRNVDSEPRRRFLAAWRPQRTYASLSPKTHNPRIVLLDRQAADYFISRCAAWRESWLTMGRAGWAFRRTAERLLRELSG